MNFKRRKTKRRGRGEALMTREERIVSAARAAFRRSCQDVEDRPDPIKRWEDIHPDMQRAWIELTAAAIGDWEATA